MRDSALRWSDLLRTCETCPFQQSSQRISIIHPHMNFTRSPVQPNLERFPICPAYEHSPNLVPHHFSQVVKNVIPRLPLGFRRNGFVVVCLLRNPSKTSFP